MSRIMTSIAVCAIVLGSVAAADAGPRHKRHYHHHYYSQGMWGAPVAQRTVRPIGPRWSGPNQCWNDEGYGRFSPCSGRGD